MNSTTSRAFLTPSRKRGKLSTALLFGSFSLFFGLVGSASAQLTSAEHDMLQNISDQSTISSSRLYTLQTTLQNLNSALGQQIPALAKDSSVIDIGNKVNSAITRLEWLNTDLLYINSDIEDGNAYLRDILAFLPVLTNSAAGRGSADVLAGNPWWATNSAFALVQSTYSAAYPDEEPNQTYTYSFPQFMSLWSSMLTVPSDSTASIVSRSAFQSNFQNYFGALRQSNGTRIRPYTWHDVMAEWQKSNAVFRTFVETYSSPSVAAAEQALDDATAYDEIEEIPSNTVAALPELEISRPSSLTGYSDIADSFEDLVDDVKPQRTTGNSVLTVIPAFRVGAISVSRVDFDFDSRIVPYCRAIMSFLWSLMAGCMIFRLLSQEWAFYTSLGRSIY